MPSRITFQVNAAATAILFVGLILLAAFTWKTSDENRKLRLQEKTNHALRDDLSEKERNLTAFHQDLQTARAQILSLESINNQNEKILKKLRRTLKTKEITIQRKSRAVFELSGQVADLKGKAHTGLGGPESLPYCYTTSWFTFHTPDVFTTGGEVISFQNIHPIITLYGISHTEGILKTEKISLQFMDHHGQALPLNAQLLDYEFAYAASSVETPKWYENIHLDLWAKLCAAYPIDTGWGEAEAGITATFWNVSLLTSLRIGNHSPPMLLVGARYCWRVF